MDALTSPRLQSILDKLEHVHWQVGGGYRLARCPSCKHPINSLSITSGEGGLIALNCHAGCEPAAGLEALGLTSRDLFPDQPRSTGPQIAATYDYRDETGVLLYQAVRFEPKAFRQRSPKPGGGWQWKLNGARRVLYRLPELLRADREAFAFVAAGEKDVDRLRSLGLVATANVGGAGKWRPEYSESLLGRHVVLLPDNDPPGRDHADKVAHALLGIAASIRVIHLESVPEKGDVSDWLDAGHTANELAEIAFVAPEWKRPPVELKPALKLVWMSDVEGEEVDWMWKDRIARGKLHLACGVPGVGKSFVCTVDIPAILTTGRAWPDGTPGPEPCEVLILVAEDGLKDTLRPRLDAAGADVRKIAVLQSRLLHMQGGGTREAQIQLARDVEEIDRLLEERPAIRAVVIDPITEFLGQVDGNSNIEVRSELAPLTQLAERRGVAVLCVSHFNKSTVGPALFRALGSIAFVAVARIAWGFIRDHEDDERVLMLPLKNNLCRTPPGLAYRIVDRRVNWEPDEVHTTADEALEPPKRGPQANKLPEAVEWLRGRLEEGCQESNQLEREARANGITKATFRRARKELNVRATKSTMDGAWYVSLPKEAFVPLSRVENNDELVEPDEHLRYPEFDEAQLAQHAQRFSWPRTESA